MTQHIDSIGAIADQFDAIVLDQWGVLHDGQAPYPGALQTVEQLRQHRTKLGVLSNSGKRAAPNLSRIAAMGFDAASFDCVMTSGEALWRDFKTRKARAKTLYPIAGKAGDATLWAHGLHLEMTDDPTQADAVLLMGLPDGANPGDYDSQLQLALLAQLPLYCSNPDFKSPRGGSTYVMSPGALARRYADMGGTVHLYGKPHRPIFTALEGALDCDPERILMIGDSLHHDIAGAQTAGWASLLICGGIHAPEIDHNTVTKDIATLAAANTMPAPDFSLPHLR